MFEHLVPPMPVTDGAGVKIRRAIGTPALSELDPFLMLDEFRSDEADDYIAGFPDHPHRGFETVTYMLAGRMRHQDHCGHSGELGPGSVQWMTAGRGIIHSEMPLQEDGLMWGFQLWINLPAKDKLCAPRYQEFSAAESPVVSLPDGAGEAKVIAGELEGASGPVGDVATNPVYLDIRLNPAANFSYTLNPQARCFLYLFEGQLRNGEDSARAPVTLVLGQGEELQIQAGDTGARFLLLAARPLREPVARYGPFVMNTREEIEQAFEDYRAGRFGMG